MQGISNFIFGNPNQNAGRNGPPRPNQSHPSTRGGLPEMIDMLKIKTSYSVGRMDLEKGDKVLLPSRLLEMVLDRFGNLPPLLVFSVSPLRTRQTTFVGVLEFVAPDDSIVLPFWLFKDMALNEDEIVRIGIVESLPKASYLKIRPHRTKFVELGDPTAILNKHLRDFTVAKKDQRIIINILNEEFMLDVMDIKPENKYNAVSLINADINLEFDVPLDYKEPVKKEALQQPEKPKAVCGVRVDNRAMKEEVTLQSTVEFDPRKNRIPKGIRKEWANIIFEGEGSKIGRN